MTTIKCLKCQNSMNPSEIIELKCKHSFCWVCINRYLKENLACKMKCPDQSCTKSLLDSEIRKVLSEEDTVEYETKCLSAVSNNHMCLLSQCRGVVSYSDPNSEYWCGICGLYNCVPCNKPHAGYDCAHFKNLSPEDKLNCCKDEIARAEKILNEKKRQSTRAELLSVDSIDIVYNDQIFQCAVCGCCVGKGDGVVMKNCCHEMCKSCLINTILESSSIAVQCVYCDDCITEQEILSVLSPDQLADYQERSINAAKRSLGNYFHCQTLNCGVLHHLATTITTFACIKCKAVNCVPCRAVHRNLSCEQYKASRGENKKLDEEIKKGNIWHCIGCQTLMQKISGCNWVQCPSCKLELCWIRKMERWGPKGRGDISGGCRCGVRGRPCDPKCTSSCTPHTGSATPDIDLMRQYLENNLTNIDQSASIGTDSQTVESIQNILGMFQNLERSHETIQRIERSHETIQRIVNSERSIYVEQNFEHDREWCSFL